LCSFIALYILEVNNFFYSKKLFFLVKKNILTIITFALKCHPIISFEGYKNDVEQNQKSEFDNQHSASEARPVAPFT